LDVYSYDWEAKSPSKFKVMEPQEFASEFGWLIKSAEAGKEPLSGTVVKSSIARIFKWKVSLHSNDAGLLSLWSSNFESEGGKPQASLYALRVPQGNGELGSLPPGSGFFSPKTLQYLVVNPSSYEEVKGTGVRLLTNELSERDAKHVALNASCAEVLGKGVCMLAPAGLGKTTHVYGLAGWTEDKSTKFHSDGWLFVNLKDKTAYSPERLYYAKGLQALSTSLRQFLHRSRKESLERFMSRDLINRDGFLVDPTELLGKGKFTRKCKVDYLILLERSEEDPWLVKPLQPEEALSTVKEGRYDGQTSSPYFNPYAVSKEREERRQSMYFKLFSGTETLLVNTRVPVWITQSLIRGIALGEWKWAKLVQGEVYVLRGERYESLFTAFSEQNEEPASKKGKGKAKKKGSLASSRLDEAP